MTTDMIVFYRARLDEDEAAALGAKGPTLGRWEEDDGPAEDIQLYAASGKLTMGQARHIARHDPARVLHEVEAKRQVLDEYDEALAQRKELAGGPHGVEAAVRLLTVLRVVRLLVLPYADHPDYEEAWRP